MKLPLNQKYLDNLLNYRESALEHAGNDRTLYLNHMLNYREFCAQSKEAQSLGEDMEKALKKAVADQDHASVQQLLFTFYQGELTAYWRSGCDHSRIIRTENGRRKEKFNISFSARFFKCFSKRTV